MKTDAQGNPTTVHKELCKAVSALVPAYDVMMHVRAIEEGTYTLAHLAEDADRFYDYGGYAIEGSILRDM